MRQPDKQPDQIVPTYENEVFADEWGTYWVPIVVGASDLERSPEEAVAIVAKLDGPFEDGIKVERVSGAVGRTGDGDVRFRVSDEGTFQCWQVDAS